MYEDCVSAGYFVGCRGAFDGKWVAIEGREEFSLYTRGLPILFMIYTPDGSSITLRFVSVLEQLGSQREIAMT